MSYVTTKPIKATNLYNICKNELYLLLEVQKTLTHTLVQQNYLIFH